MISNIQRQRSKENCQWCERFVLQQRYKGTELLKYHHRQRNENFIEKKEVENFIRQSMKQREPQQNIIKLILEFGCVFVFFGWKTSASDVGEKGWNFHMKALRKDLGWRRCSSHKIAFICALIGIKHKSLHETDSSEARKARVKGKKLISGLGAIVFARWIQTAFIVMLVANYGNFWKRSVITGNWRKFIRSISWPMTNEIFRANTNAAIRLWN